MKILDFIKSNVLILYIIAVVFGFLFHNFSFKFQNLIPYLVFLVIYFSAFRVESKEVLKSFKNIKYNAVILIVHFLLFPISFMYISSKIFGFDGLILAGIIFIFTLPTAATNVLYSNLYKGNTSLVLTLLLITSLISPIVTPLIFYLLTKNIVTIDFFSIFVKMTLIVVLPFLLANLTKKLKFSGMIKENSDSYSTLPFIAANFIAGGIIYNSGIIQNPISLIKIVLFLITSFILSFIIIYLISKKIKNKKYAISLSLITTRRNTSLGVGIAIGTLSPIVITVLLLYQFIMDIFGLFIGRLLNEEA